jgi:hypothetical protein
VKLIKKKLDKLYKRKKKIVTKKELLDSPLTHYKLAIYKIKILVLLVQVVKEK